MQPITLNGPILKKITNAAISLRWAHLKIKINATNRDVHGSHFSLYF
jgi:hypothetical protein